MAEYIELNELQKFCRKYTEVDVVGLILANRTDLLHTADVVERPKYETICIKCNNLENRVEKQNQNIKRLKEYQKIIETENEELRSKIDKAIEEMNSIYEGLIMDCDEMRDYCVEILKRNIGE